MIQCAFLKDDEKKLEDADDKGNNLIEITHGQMSIKEISMQSIRMWESSLESFDLDHFLPLLLCPSFSHLSLYILSGNIEDTLNDHASRWFLLLLILISYMLDISPIPNLHQLLSPQIERYQGICFIDLLSFQLITECLYGNCSHVLFLSCVQILGKKMFRDMNGMLSMNTSGH